jgi:hypothetical protein
MIGAGHFWPIASGWVDRVAARLEKNSPPMRDVIDRRLFAHGANDHRDIFRPRDARSPNATKPNPSLQVTAQPEVATDGTPGERTSY